MVQIETEYKKTEYMSPSEIGAPLLRKPPPTWRPKKKQNILAWIDEQKHAKLLKILFVIVIVLTVIGTLLWGFSYVIQGFAEGGTVESDNRIAHFMGGLALKLASVPITPI